ncbi:MAG TPA: M1 family aminopeptidase [Elusimicrobiota bacterium]|jgi:aminopeptidase N|nr:M1 family aminopeptidase [Elusimicrobiota bacterium]
MTTRELGLSCCRHFEARDIKSVLLGKDPRYAPHRAFDTLHVRLELSVDLSGRTLSGTCTTTARAFDRLTELEFDACGMTILGAKAGGETARFTHKDGKLKVKLPKAALEVGDEVEVEVRYRVRKPVAGLHFVKPGKANGAQMWTQGQPEDSRFWFPCHDAPHEKATSEVIARVPLGFVAVSNGVLVDRTRHASAETFHWRMDRPHALYLVTLVVGRFAEVRERWEDVDVLYYCERGREEDAKRGFRKTIPAMDFFSKKLGVSYPYPKYAQIAVAEFPGGMENTTATTQTDACLIPKAAALDNDLDTLVAHELAHQWFGNLVTCRDWSHAWLNEGFATYFEMLFMEHDKGADEADYERHLCRQSYFHEDEGRYRRPIVHNAYKYPWVLFDRHLYEKGACVLHMLRQELGDERWWRAIRHYLESNQNSSVETPDLATAIEEATGRNLRRFFDQWIHRSGYPTLQATYSYDDKTKEAILKVLQKGSDSTGLYRLPLKIVCAGFSPAWTRDSSVLLEKKEQEFRVKVPSRPQLVELDPRGDVLKRIEFRKPFPLWLAQLRRGTCALSRVHAARSVASWGDDAAVAALAAALKAEKFWGAACEIASALGGIRSEASFQALQAGLSHPHPKVRRAVVAALGGFARKELAPRWKSLLRSDSSYHVRAEAARALGALRDSRHVGDLKTAMRAPSYWDIVAGGAIQGLAATRRPEALRAVQAACRSPYGYPARAYAIRAVGQFAGAREEVVPFLTKLLEDILKESDERLAMAVISTLGSTGDFRALQALEKARTHADSRIKTYAEEAIARIQGESEPAEKAGKK